MEKEDNVFEELKEMLINKSKKEIVDLFIDSISDSPSLAKRITFTLQGPHQADFFLKIINEKLIENDNFFNRLIGYRFVLDIIQREESNDWQHLITFLNSFVQLIELKKEFDKYLLYAGDIDEEGDYIEEHDGIVYKDYPGIDIINKISNGIIEKINLLIQKNKEEEIVKELKIFLLKTINIADDLDFIFLLKEIVKMINNYDFDQYVIDFIENIEQQNHSSACSGLIEFALTIQKKHFSEQELVEFATKYSRYYDIRNIAAALSIEQKKYSKTIDVVLGYFEHFDDFNDLDDDALKYLLEAYIGLSDEKNTRKTALILLKRDHIEYLDALKSTYNDLGWNKIIFDTNSKQDAKSILYPVLLCKEERWDELICAMKKNAQLITRYCRRTPSKYNEILLVMIKETVNKIIESSSRDYDYSVLSPYFDAIKYLSSESDLIDYLFKLEWVDRRRRPLIEFIREYRFSELDYFNCYDNLF